MRMRTVTKRAASVSSRPFIFVIPVYNRSNFMNAKVLSLIALTVFSPFGLGILRAENRNQPQTQHQTNNDDDEFDNTGEPEPGGQRIYNGFDDFNNTHKKAVPGQKGAMKMVEAHGIQTVVKSYGSCAGFVPNDWTVSGAENNVAIGIDFRSMQQAEGATYMIAAVPVYVDAYGRDFYGSANPTRYIQSTLGLLDISGFQYTSQATQLPGGYSLMFWQGYVQGQPVRGFAHYMTFPSGTGSGYIIALRYGFTPASLWQKRMNVVYDAAASARCQKRLFPVQNSGVPSSHRSASHEPKGSSEDLSTLREETTMEYQNVYSPSTGQHWEASWDDYNPTGPDGPGYYRQVGNSYEKLEAGFPPGY
jgi:hypothetical protein